MCGTSPFFSARPLKKSGLQPTHLATCHAVMGGDKEVRQVALKTRREPLMECVGWLGKGNLRPKIYMLMPRTIYMDWRIVSLIRFA